MTTAYFDANAFVELVVLVVLSVLVVFVALAALVVLPELDVLLALVVLAGLVALRVQLRKCHHRLHGLPEFCLVSKVFPQRLKQLRRQPLACHLFAQ